LLSTPSDRERLGRAGRRSVERFAFASMIDATETVLRESVTGSGASQMTLP
jgi:hypothetical protein